MAFTDRFISITVPVFDRESAELIGYNEKTSAGEALFKINPFEISHYRESFSTEKNKNEILIHFRNGDSFQIDMDLINFEKLLNNHSNEKAI